MECLLRDTASASPAASSDAPILAELIARTGAAEPGLRWPLTSSRVTMGTVELSGVPRLATEVVGCRAEITLRDGIWLVTDLGSETIRVDGEPLQGTSPLAPGSTIRCGELEAVFLPHDVWAPVAPTPTAAAPRPARPIQTPLFAMPTSAPRRVPAWLILSLVVLAAIATAAAIILGSR